MNSSRRNRSHTSSLIDLRPGGRTRSAFTLVELLVVIGIIAVLIGILLPTLNRAREGARTVKCLSNMRNLSQAVLMFTVEQKGKMPGRAGTSVLMLDPSSGNVRAASSTEAAEGSSYDWIAWMRKKDPITGDTNTASAADQNITYSALAKYMGGKFAKHTNADEANRFAEKLQEVFRCPSDNLPNRTKNMADNNGNRGAYRYSYSINDRVALKQGNPYTFQNPTWPAPNPPASVPDGLRSWGMFSGKINSIKRASEIILFVCESELTIDDGVFTPNPYNWGSGAINAVATRHDLKTARAKGNAFGTNDANENGWGIVSFCDGHAERMSRVDALRQKHTGNPFPDPASAPFVR